MYCCRQTSRNIDEFGPRRDKKWWERWRRRKATYAQKEIPSIERRVFSGYKSPVGLVKEALIKRFFLQQESSDFELALVPLWRLDFLRSSITTWEKKEEKGTRNVESIKRRHLPT